MAKVTAVRRPPNKDVAQLMERLAEGFVLVKDSRSGHFHVQGPDSSLVRAETGQPISIAGTPSSNGPNYMKRLTSELDKAGVLAKTNGQVSREGTPDEELREEQARQRQTHAESLASARRWAEETAVWVKKLGGWEARGMTADLGRIAYSVAPDSFATLEAAMAAISTAKKGDSPGSITLGGLWKLHEKMMAEEDPREYFFDAIRELRGLNPVKIETGAEWPFTVELIQLSDMIVDQTYQRPIHDLFARDLMLRFDERLVSTIDVSKRKNGKYAILDGLQRTTAMRELGKTACFCSVYEGMSVSEEAEFFYHKNKDRKAIHPYYHFRARLVSGDRAVTEINKIVEKAGFKLGVTIQSPDQIVAIRAIEKIYSFSSPWREEPLTPTLDLVKRLWFGRRNATDGELLRGLGRFFQAYSDQEIQWQHLDEILAELGPQLVIGRAKDAIGTLTGGRGGSGGLGVARTICEIHNTGLLRAQRLDIRRLSSSPAARASAMALATS